MVLFLLFSKFPSPDGTSKLLLLGNHHSSLLTDIDIFQSNLCKRFTMGFLYKGIKLSHWWFPCACFTALGARHTSWIWLWLTFSRNLDVKDVRLHSFIHLVTLPFLLHFFFPEKKREFWISVLLLLFIRVSNHRNCSDHCFLRPASWDWFSFRIIFCLTWRGRILPVP